jgi:hypothetical protein
VEREKIKRIGAKRVIVGKGKWDGIKKRVFL